nr:MAG TPA: hypothetical protein [Bacteriophage sp.]
MCIDKQSVKEQLNVPLFIGLRLFYERSITALVE